MKKYAKYDIGHFTYGEPRILDWTGVSKLKIGKFCSISSDVVIFLDGNHDYSTLSTYPLELLFNKSLRMGSNITSKGDINIGNDVWIGFGATIMSGVTIGHGAIIGTRCLVSKDVAPYTIVVGNPQRTIGTRFSIAEIENLLKLEWWNLPLDALNSLTYIFEQRRNQHLNLMSKLSVAIVIYNEEKHLAECLESLGNISDDIVIIHDGVCTDKSKDIANSFGARFYERSRIGVAEGHRIDSFNLTTGEWILVLDADERLSDELREAIPFLINDDRIDAYEFIWPLYDGKRVICDSWPHKKALFRRNKIKYINFPHAELSTNGHTRRTNLTLRHEPNYNNFTYDRFTKKWVQWAKIQAKLSLKDFSEIPKVGYDEQKTWTRNFLFKRKYPELFLFYGLYDAYKSIKTGGYVNIYALKGALMWGLYNAMVYYYVSKEKWLKK